MKNIIEKFVGT